MARYDKVEPLGGSFRAAIAANTSKNSAGNPVGVGLNSSGQVVAGAGNSGIVGVLVLTKDVRAGAIVDVMKDGEIVEMASPAVAGTVITADTTTGALGVTAPDSTHIRVGHTVTADRLIVGVAR